MTAVFELETAQPTHEPFPTQRLANIHDGLQSGRPGAQEQLVDLIGNPSYFLDSLRYYGDIGYTEETIRAIELLPLVDPNKSLPVITGILEKGCEGRELQLIVSAAASAASKIRSPRTAELITLIDSNLARLTRDSTEYVDDEESEFRIPRNTAIESLDKAKTSVLWNTAGRARDTLANILPFTRKGQSFLVMRADPATRSIVCFDLEGPLSGQDCAYEVFKKVPDGEQMFRVISYYDDMACGLIPGRREWRREGYEAGDTLKLILPQLIHHGITERDISDVSATATLVPGVRQLFEGLRNDGWKRKIVSTSYAQHAQNIGGQLRLRPEDIYCTQLPLDAMANNYSRESADLIKQFERRLKGFSPDDFGTPKDDELKAALDKFYWEDLPQTRMGQATDAVSVMGGARKAWAVERVARDAGAFIENMVFVGDSITDSQAAKVMEAMRGLMIAFNGNDFVVPFATVGFATTNMSHLRPALDVWQGNGRAGLREWTNSQPRPQGEFDTNFDWVVDATDKRVGEIVDTHRRFRRKLREDAASLG